ncbi:MAG: FtsW/RodA/SpoVE family cell cycle protein, partial [Clostridia bacterium]|nr:FtsW/RodA/SpoVE family cell cycle protein [Clostridia bacterium]
MAVAARSGKKRLRSLLQGINVRKYIEARGGLFARGSIDPIFFTLLVALVVVGLAMLYSATYVYAYYYENSSTYYLKKQLFAVVLGFILMFAVSHINYRILTHVAAVAGT